ncbi:uncharacterized protein LOC132259120 [Phlebotomus argentipes]|uniref:uncharacterized protein LOC132259120 n=1 Tax=Phlebotomus argentipes TaxID=94469 RepID=UPI002892A5C1|nr:uncharacterized protein LOC132259120 [Phlebotomus argentipes]
MLLVVLVMRGAHESAAETTADLLDATASKDSVVHDWKAVCEHLQRINLSGSGCRPWWYVLRPPVTESLPQEQLDLMCPTLCSSSLGLPSCVCIVPYRDLSAADRDNVCQLFCSVTGSNLRGCTECVDNQTTTEMMTVTTESSSTTSTASSTTTRTTSTTKSTTKAPTTTTTPDWGALCNVLCQIGEGGVLCNCDLPPFF